MAGFKIAIDTRKLTAALEVLASKQVPFATATALNDLAFQVQRAERAAIGSLFDNPRPFTRNSVQVDKATKAALTVTVFIRPEVAKYLEPYEDGGLHVLPGKALLNPKDIRLDQYGQLPRDTMQRLAARPDIYIGPIQTRHGGLVNGVWQRVAVSRKGGVRRKRVAGSTIHDATHGALKLLIRFGDPLPVRKHLGFRARAEDLVKSEAPAAFERAIDRALATMRR